MEAASEGTLPATNGGGSGPVPAVPERLQQRDAERREEAERRRRAREAQTVQEEQSDVFAAAFAREQAAIEALLRPGGEAEAVAEAGERLQALQRSLTDSVRFLAPYEVRRAQAALQGLQGALSERRLQLQPQKRFAFKKALKKEPAPRRTPPEQEPDPEKEVPPAAFQPGCGFSDAEDQELQMGPQELLQKDVILSQLSRCRVRLRGNPNTLLVRHCRDCIVLCGPVSTSARVDNCSGCTLALACQQLRTNRTTDTSFYLHVTSKAMLEECKGIRFAPYPWSYEGLEADYETSGLDRSRNHWSQVDDFDWLARDEASPNWSIIPEKDRVTDWN
ncbi:tubulin-specific chaperone C [Anolis carolinensis]|uniref:Tubulin-specific chaperone C n=1 Tax=Anolis carolinensis TaxID=28377 RepID=G1K8N1_ANOCA|nr:PREDICTED: tubulin-specific chaperone C [Anolis carolinensis]|eukprot:XP_003216048.1 PREDICTED: tubulin-specific chaperone C [Anolis carolinensis]